MNRMDVIKISNNEARHIANACTAIAECSYKDPPFMRKVSSVVVDVLPNWPGNLGKDLPSILWAFAKLNICDNVLLTTSAEALLPLIGRVPNWGICALAWSLPNLDPQGDLKDLKQAVHKLLQNRGLTSADVKQSILG